MICTYDTDCVESNNGTYCTLCQKGYSIGRDGRCTSNGGCYRVNEYGVCVECKRGYSICREDGRCVTNSD